MNFAPDLLRTAPSEGGFCLKTVEGESTFGSVETLTSDTVSEASVITGGWAQTIADAIPVTDSAIRIRAAIDAVVPQLELGPLTKVGGDGFSHGIMLGALDAQYEFESGDQVSPAEFAEGGGADFLLVATDPSFVSMPYEAAVREFLGLKPITRKAFNALDELARVRAFTVSGASRTSIVRTVQRELARQVARGADLRDFRDRVVPRLEKAGWTPKNPSHVENVFRTNTMKAYSAGRVEHSRRPSVLKARPYWNWRGVEDGPPRQRESHQKAHGFSMLAVSPEWAKIYPPAGFMCRCRVIVLSLKKAGKIVESILAAVSPLRLVDVGFRAGVPALMRDGGTELKGRAQVQVPAKLEPRRSATAA